MVNQLFLCDNLKTLFNSMDEYLLLNLKRPFQDRRGWNQSLCYAVIRWLFITWFPYRFQYSSVYIVEFLICSRGISYFSYFKNSRMFTPTSVFEIFAIFWSLFSWLNMRLANIFKTCLIGHQTVVKILKPCQFSFNFIYRPR